MPGLLWGELLKAEERIKADDAAIAKQAEKAKKAADEAARRARIEEIVAAHNAKKAAQKAQAEAEAETIKQREVEERKAVEKAIELTDKEMQYIIYVLARDNEEDDDGGSLTSGMSPPISPGGSSSIYGNPDTSAVFDNDNVASHSAYTGSYDLSRSGSSYSNSSRSFEDLGDSSSSMKITEVRSAGDISEGWEVWN